MEQKNDNHLYISGAIADNLPSMVKNELAKMPAQKQTEFLEEYKRKNRSVSTAYLLFLFLGAHYAYQGRWGMQILFWMTVGGFFIWWLVDLFRLYGVINNYNKDLALDVMRNLKSISQ